jgi:hypothetical protein
MALTLVPAGTSPSTDPTLTPEYISLGVENDGGGGTLALNMQGVNDPTVAGAKDLSTFFGKNINELPIARAFRPIYNPFPWNNGGGGGPQRTSLARVQICANLAIVIYPLGTDNIVLGVGYDGNTVNGVQVPFLNLIGSASEAGAQTWRVDLQLRHSITC